MRTGYCFCRDDGVSRLNFGKAMAEANGLSKNWNQEMDKQYPQLHNRQWHILCHTTANRFHYGKVMAQMREL